MATTDGQGRAVNPLRARARIARKPDRRQTGWFANRMVQPGVPNKTAGTEVTGKSATRAARLSLSRIAERHTVMEVQRDDDYVTDDENAARGTNPPEDGAGPAGSDAGHGKVQRGQQGRVPQEEAHFANPRADEDFGDTSSKVWSAAPLTVWAFSFVLLRIFAVSGYDWNTAFNVSTTLNISDGLNLVFGSLMGGHILVEILAVILLPLLVADFLWAPTGRRPGVILPMVVGIVILVAVAVSYRALWLIAVAVGVFGLYSLVHALPKGFPARRALAVAMRRVGLVSGIGVLVAAAFVTTPWVPREEITTTDGVLTGYVLSVDSGFLNVLTEDHEFTVIPLDAVLARD